jgi:hypothetical protein
MKSAQLLFSLLLLGSVGCAAHSAQGSQAELAQVEGASGPNRCLASALHAGDVVGVEPLWVKNTAIKYPAYNLGGVIVALRSDMSEADLQRVAMCRTACNNAADGTQATIDTTAGRPEMVVRTDDPRAAQAMFDHAERLMRATP